MREREGISTTFCPLMHIISSSNSEDLPEQCLLMPALVDEVGAAADLALVSLSLMMDQMMRMSALLQVICLRFSLRIFRPAARHFSKDMLRLSTLQ